MCDRRPFAFELRRRGYAAQVGLMTNTLVGQLNSTKRALPTMPSAGFCARSARVTTTSVHMQRTRRLVAECLKEAYISGKPSER